MKIKKINYNILYKQISWVYERTYGFKLTIFFATLLALLYSLLSVAFVWMFKNMVDIATHAKSGSLYEAVLWIACILILQQVLSILNSFLSQSLMQRFHNRLRLNTFHYVLQIKWMELAKYHTGNLLTRLNNDTSTVVNLAVNLIPSIFINTIHLATVFCVMIVLDPAIAALSLIFLPIAYVLFVFFGNKLKKFNHEYQQSISENTGFIQETIQNPFVVKAFGLQTQLTKKLEYLQEKTYKIVWRKNVVTVASGSALQFGFSISYIAAFLFSAFRMTKGTLTFGGLSAFLQLISQIQGPVSNLTDSISKTFAASVSVERLMEILTLPQDEPLDSTTCSTPTGIRMENVSYAYENEEWILKNISTDFPPSTSTAIIGKTGAGKTTLIRLLLSFIEPASGTISLYSANNPHLNVLNTRAYFSYVPQGNSLFSGSIKENILMGNPNATNDQLRMACETACCEFIWDFKNGMDTLLGEKNMGLSEGQALRIAIARALIHTAPILIFDEATSALDEWTQSLVFERIKENYAQKTLIFITHKLSMASQCDKILQIDIPKTKIESEA